MGRCFSATTFLSAGNITHTPAYGHLIAMGVQTVVNQRNASPEQRANAEAYRALIARTGRFLTFAAGAATIGYRLREDPAERAALRIVKETDKGLVIRGKIGMHTSPAFAHDVYIGAHNGVDYKGHRATFVVAVNAPGVTVVCRKPAARDGNPFSAPLSTRFDELDGQMWLDDVLIPWDRVFLTEPFADPVARWLFWHQLYCWLSKAEFTLGLALACTHAMGLASHDATVEYLVDLITDVQTVRSCQTAAELDPEFTPEGYCSPNPLHLSAGSIAMLKARPRMGEVLRTLARLVAGRGADRSRSRRAGAGPGPGGILRRRRLHRPAARGPAADGVGPCRLRARPSRIGLRAARQWRHPVLARAPAPQLQPLRGAGQRRAAAPEPADAEGRPAVDPQCAAGRAPAGQPDRAAAEACGHGTDKKPRYGGESALTTAP